MGALVNIRWHDPFRQMCVDRPGLLIHGIISRVPSITQTRYSLSKIDCWYSWYNSLVYHFIGFPITAKSASKSWQPEYVRDNCVDFVWVRTLSFSKYICSMLCLKNTSYRFSYCRIAAIWRNSDTGIYQREYLSLAMPTSEGYIIRSRYQSLENVCCHCDET